MIDIKKLLDLNKKLRKELTEELVRLGFKVNTLMDNCIVDNFSIKQIENSSDYVLVMTIHRTILCYSFEDLKHIFIKTYEWRSREQILPDIDLDDRSYEPKLNPDHYHFRNSSEHPNMASVQNLIEVSITFIKYIPLI